MSNKTIKHQIKGVEFGAYFLKIILRSESPYLNTVKQTLTSNLKVL